MHTFINSPWSIGSLKLPHRLIQGPLAGYSCAPFRSLFYQFKPPAYCVSEMCSAQDVIYKHSPLSRYRYRAPVEQRLAYQISGQDPNHLAQAARILQEQGADLIDINCGCPKTKIRKKNAGSALLEQPDLLIDIIRKVRETIHIPLTVKIRIQKNEADILLAQQIEQAGADALIVHGRHWTEDYDIPNNLLHIREIKRNLRIAVIANGDIACTADLQKAIDLSECDGFMIARGGTGKPWLYQNLLQNEDYPITYAEQVALFIEHLQGLAQLESEFKAVLQSKSLVKYYFRNQFSNEQLKHFYSLNSLADIACMLEGF